MDEGHSDLVVPLSAVHTIRKERETHVEVGATDGYASIYLDYFLYQPRHWTKKVQHQSWMCWG